MMITVVVQYSTIQLWYSIEYTESKSFCFIVFLILKSSINTDFERDDAHL